jgi:membrane fusion protein (multidrug efflux system)
MASAGKPRTELVEKTKRSRKRASKRESRTSLPVLHTRDAIGGLLGTTAAPRRHRGPHWLWRYGRWVLAATVVVAATFPIVHWLQYRSAYVMSSNAAVRGHLSEIGTRSAGLVSTVEVDVGDRVKAGQVLVRMEDRYLLAEVQEARAEIEGLERGIDAEHLDIQHDRLQARQLESETQAKIAAAGAQAEAARLRAEQAKRDFEKREKLFNNDGVVSGEDVQEARTRWGTAEASLDEAKANSAAAVSVGESARLVGGALTLRERKIGVMEAELLKAQARLSRAEANLDAASIRAPEDGAIVRRIVQPGGSVEAGQPILSMWLGDDVWVEAWVDEDDIGAVSLGSAATVTFHSFPGREFAGVVDQIGLATDLAIPDSEVPQPRGSRMRSAPVVGVRIRLTEPPPELLPGLTAVVAIRKPEP